MTGCTTATRGSGRVDAGGAGIIAYMEALLDPLLPLFERERAAGRPVVLATAATLTGSGTTVTATAVTNAIPPGIYPNVIAVYLPTGAFNASYSAPFATQLTITAGTRGPKRSKLNPFRAGRPTGVAAGGTTWS